MIANAISDGRRVEYERKLLPLSLTAWQLRHLMPRRPRDYISMQVDRPEVGQAAGE